jgi:alkanesulfonate monooxygenase SsuD/methylene tetrahydromethanopterin reductase-like flavin-dependent oxidoreductase (luciferase family)
VFKPIVDAYVEGWEQYGHPVEQRRIGCCSHFSVAKDGRSARERWKPRHLHYLNSVNEWQIDSTRRVGIEGRPAYAVPPFESLVETIAICGSPAEVVDRMGEARELFGLDTHLLMMDHGGVPDDELFAAIELTGAEVIPQLG